jgi:hypothetical protein
LPKELIAIWSAYTLPACPQKHLGSTQLASDHLTMIDDGIGAASPSLARSLTAACARCLA